MRQVGPEVGSEVVGKAVLDGLRALDPVTYLRFASVYKGFEDLTDFEREVGACRRRRPPRGPRSGRSLLPGRRCSFVHACTIANNRERLLTCRFAPRPQLTPM